MSAADPVFVAAGHGEVVGDSPDRRVEILSDVDSLHATWSRFAAGRDGADLHVHHGHTDLFYVLEGELTLRLGPEGTGHALPAGTLACVPPLVVHGFRNASRAESRHLNFHAPGRGFADFMRALRDGRAFAYDQFDPPPGGGRDPADAVLGRREPLVDRGGLQATLLADAEDITVVAVTADAGPSSPERHVYRQVRSLYVLEGELALTTAKGERVAQAGAWVQVPAGVRHAIGVAGSEQLRFLDIHTPGSNIGRLAGRPRVRPPWALRRPR